MMPKELINNFKSTIEAAISKAEFKSMPHFYADDKETTIVYQDFIQIIKKYYKTLLSSDKIKKITANLDEKRDNFFDFYEYFNSSNINKNIAIDEIFNLPKKYANHHHMRQIANNLVDFSIDFIEQIKEEIIDSSKIKNQKLDIKEEEDGEDNNEIMEEINHDSLFSLNNGILPLSSIDNFSRFQQLTGKNFLFCVGRPSNNNINEWVNAFCKNAPISMSSIGLQETDISLNKSIEYYYHHFPVEEKQRGNIQYNLKEDERNIKELTAFRVSFKPSNEKLHSTLLHEWLHGLDLEIGHLLKTETGFASEIFMEGNAKYTVEPLANILNQGSEVFAWNLSGVDSESYIENKDEFIQNFKQFAINKIGNNIHHEWENLDDAKKAEVQSHPSFEKLINLSISNLRNNSSSAEKKIAKHLCSIVRSEELNSIFSNVKHFPSTLHAKKLLAEVAQYSLDNNITWFKGNSKKENFALTYTDFSKSSSLRGYVKKEEYKFLPHEIFARVGQIFTMEPIFYERPNQGKDFHKNLIADRKVITECGTFTEMNLHGRAQTLKLIHLMCNQIGIQPLVKYNQLIPSLSNQCIAVDRKVEDRGRLTTGSKYINNLNNQYRKVIKDCSEKIEITRNKQNLKELNTNSTKNIKF